MHRWMREDLRTGMNALGEDTYTNALVAVAVANGKGAWSGLTGALAVPASVGHAGKIWMLLVDVPDVAAEAPGISVVWQDVTPANPDYLVKPGQLGFFAMSTAPAGWLKANGAAISRTTYSELFAAIGTVHGVGDGSTTFNIPDRRGEFIRGWDDGRGVDSGRVFGSAQSSQNLAHTHGVTNSGTNATMAGSSRWVGGTAAGSTTLTSASSGGTEARPRNVADLICIKY